MNELKDYRDAENVVRKWVADKYPKNNTFKFKRVWREGDLWMVEGEIWVRKGIMKWEKKVIEIKMSSNTGEILGYSAE